MRCDPGFVRGLGDTALLLLVSLDPRRLEPSGLVSAAGGDAALFAGIALARAVLAASVIMVSARGTGIGAILIDAAWPVLGPALASMAALVAAHACRSDASAVNNLLGAVCIGVFTALAVSVAGRHTPGGRRPLGEIAPEIESRVGRAARALGLSGVRAFVGEGIGVNAYTDGRDVIIGDGLLDTPGAAFGIILHEMGHLAMGHPMRTAVAAVLRVLLAAGAAAVPLKVPGAACLLGCTSSPARSAALSALVAATLTWRSLGVLILMMTRRFEEAADGVMISGITRGDADELTRVLSRPSDCGSPHPSASSRLRRIAAGVAKN
jgi:hypothetical protein